jgi:hypothetical protein
MREVRVSDDCLMSTGRLFVGLRLLFISNPRKGNVLASCVGVRGHKEIITHFKWGC